MESASYNTDQYLKQKIFLTGCILVEFSCGFANINSEHNNFGSHGRHFVGKAICVYSIHVSFEGILSIAGTLTRLNSLSVWTNNIEINIQKSTFCHFKCQT